MRIQESMTMYEKLNILTDAAKYDVACTSSGTARANDGTGMGSCEQTGICHSFSADGRCILSSKILYTNECIYDCKYCINRRPMMSGVHLLRRMKCARLLWSFTGAIISRVYS